MPIQSHMRQDVFEAIWVPDWYELDQSLKVGDSRDFLFFRAPPLALASSGKPVLYHGLLSAAPHLTVRCEILRITHPGLGDLVEVETGLDYGFIPWSGDRVDVDAEYHLGRAHNSTLQMEDWTLTVTMRRVAVWVHVRGWILTLAERLVQLPLALHYLRRRWM